jgi:hypothetical protein
MSLDNPGGSEPPDRHKQFVLIVVATVLAFAAIVVLAVTGHAVTAAVIATVWAATCGLLAGWKPPPGGPAPKATP